MKSLIIAVFLMAGCCAAQDSGYGLTVPDPLTPENCVPFAIRMMEVAANKLQDENTYFGRCLDDLEQCAGTLHACAQMKTKSARAAPLGSITGDCFIVGKDMLLHSILCPNKVIGPCTKPLGCEVEK